ncbi:MAG: peptide chain release factor N(5)-glutamine methyltransferase [Pseudomonadota bacterium]
MIIAEALAEARAALAHVDGGARDARWLLASALGVKRDRLTLMERDEIGDDKLTALRAMVAKRAHYVPVSHLIGEREFYGRMFYVTRDVLDPRPETETLVAAALEEPFERVLDLGTGSGAILMTLLAEQVDATGLGTDVSIGALAIAEKNARRMALLKRVQVIRSDWWETVTGQFDLIVSNPPYVAQAEMAGLGPELRHEPQGALTDGEDGLSAYRAILWGASEFLAPGGRIVLEFGAGQARAVEEIAQAARYTDTEFRQDMDGRDRVLIVKADS